MNIFINFNLIVASAYRLIKNKLLYYRAVKVFTEQSSNRTFYKARSESPIIIIGMHRSGTTLTSRLLEDLGVSMGKKKEINTSEDLFFRRLNELLFTLSKATWDNPKSVSYILQNQEWHDALTRIIDHELNITNLIRLPLKSRVQNKRILWGFKDPRNTYTLPIWLKIFPNAKVINIVRNGESVASSLVNRENKVLKGGKSLSLISLHSSLSLDLWAEYVMTAHKNCSALSDEKFLELKYEALLESPKATIRQILSFLKIDVNQELVNKAASRITHPQSPVLQVSHISPKAQKVLELYNYKKL